MIRGWVLVKDNMVGRGRRSLQWNFWGCRPKVQWNLPYWRLRVNMHDSCGRTNGGPLFIVIVVISVVDEAVCDRQNVLNFVLEVVLIIGQWRPGSRLLMGGVVMVKQSFQSGLMRKRCVLKMPPIRQLDKKLMHFRLAPISFQFDEKNKNSRFSEPVVGFVLDLV